MSYLRYFCVFVGGPMSYLRYFCLFVGGPMSYLRYFCLFVGGPMSYLRYFFCRRTHVLFTLFLFVYRDPCLIYVISVCL